MHADTKTWRCLWNRRSTAERASASSTTSKQRVRLPQIPGHLGSPNLIDQLDCSTRVSGAESAACENFLVGARVQLADPVRELYFAPVDRDGAMRRAFARSGRERKVSRFG